MIFPKAGKIIPSSLLGDRIIYFLFPYVPFSLLRKRYRFDVEHMTCAPPTLGGKRYVIRTVGVLQCGQVYRRSVRRPNVRIAKYRRIITAFNLQPEVKSGITQRYRYLRITLFYRRR